MTNLKTLAIRDANLIARLIDNGEYDRALTYARLLTTTIENVMRENNITPSLTTIHDTTPAI
jgi:hypothetical protein